MKKIVQIEPNMADVIIKIQEQLVLLEKKLDTVISQTAAKSFEVKPQQRPFQRFDQPYRQSENRQNNEYRERVLHKAVCAECNKGCEVPFKPREDRPVYCKDCFAKRKGPSTFGANNDSRPAEARPSPERAYRKPYSAEGRKHSGGEGRKPSFKKKHIARKGKKRF